MSKEIEKQDTNKEQPSIDTQPKKIPSIKIKRNLIFIIAGVLIAIMTYAFLTASLKKSSGNSKNIQQNLEENQEINTSKSIDPAFLGTNYGNIDRDNDELKTSYQNVLKSEDIVQQPEILGENLKLEEYYTGLVQEEIQARNSEIDYGDSSSYNSTSQIQQKEFEENINTLLSSKKRNEYNSSNLKAPLFKHELKAGSVIPSILLTGINSDLPGDMIATVREDVYDTITGKKLLIPKGTRILGTYDSGINFGQERILIVWQRLIFPNGKSLMLDNFPGVDLSGYAGLTGKVDNHTLKLVQSVVLTSVLGGLSATIKKEDKTNDEILNEFIKSGGETIIDIGESLTQKILNIKPTIKVKPGSRFTIIVNADLSLEPYIR